MTGYGGGIPSTWLGNRASQQTNKHEDKQKEDCNTAVGSRHWVSRLERRPVPSFGGCLHFPDRTSCCCCCCYASFNATPLPPPPLALGPNGVLIELPPTLYLKRSSFCCILPLLNEPALPAPLCSLYNTAEPLARFLRRQRTFFLFDGQVKRR